ncbi:MAG TPA: class I SAM-dependent methyltransferase [Kofleriaceae bacterium]|nr:class I SAM-dependent methyltransferase [Kofleriaceae bacterium]
MTTHAQLAEMLGNRLAKNARHLGKWAKRERVTCWRVYDRDIPEVPITVDTYEGALVINDYRAFDKPDADGWLDELTSRAKQVLGASEAFVKQRERLVGRREGHQYERLGETPSAWRIVKEGGHRFRVNLADYLDTGLFLDHRITRARVAAEPAKTMLNLFAYTGSFSVYAAAAGMRTTTVDMSRTYVDWAGDNLAENGLDGELVQSDVREFLQTARRERRHWDLAVVDPPTFSNSKRMDYTWDVQRDHAALLDDVAAVADVIWFSNNRRRFTLEWSRPGAEVRDETRATIPPDFRDTRVHHAFRIALRERRA